MAEDLESGPSAVYWGPFDDRTATGRLGDRQALGKDFKFLRRQTLHRAKVPELVLEVAGRILKPVAVHIGAMNSERCADGVPEFLGADLVLSGKDFDPLNLLERSLDRNI